MKTNRRKSPPKSALLRVARPEYDKLMSLRMRSAGEALSVLIKFAESNGFDFNYVRTLEGSKPSADKRVAQVDP